MASPPGPQTRTPWGLLPNFHRDPLTLLETLGQEYSPLTRLPFGPWTLYLAVGAEAVEDVLRSHRQHFRKGPGMDVKNPLLGRGLLLSEGETWRSERHALGAAFQPQAYSAYERAMRQEIARRVALVADGETVDVADFSRQLALAVAIQAFFGVDPDSGQMAAVGQAVENLMRHFYSRARSLWRPPYPWPQLFNRTFYHAARGLTGFVEHALEKGQSPFLDALAQLPADQRMAEAVTFLIAGHETTANALAWTLLLLSRHPEVAEHVAGETETSSASGLQLPYVRAVAFEALRLFPPVWLMSRTAVDEVGVAGYRLPSGADFLVSPWVTHRQAAYYAQATAFCPERWLTGNAVHGSSRNYRFIAFGAGPRRCPGEHFAVNEITLAISAVCRRFTLIAASAFPAPRAGMTLAPGPGRWVRWETRR